jgi:hypothetical protein
MPADHRQRHLGTRSTPAQRRSAMAYCEGALGSLPLQWPLQQRLCMLRPSLCAMANVLAADMHTAAAMQHTLCTKEVPATGEV